MGYSNVAGALNVFTSTSTQDLIVRGDTTHVGNITAVRGYAAFGNVAVANLVVTGNFTITATNTQTTNALTINNAGTATALKVMQFEGGGPGHTYNVAEFWDFQTLAMVIDPEGNVGIHTSSSPGYALTVAQGALIDTVTSQLFTGNGSGLSNLQVTSLVGALAPSQLQTAQTNVTQVGTLTGLYSSGNVSAPFFIGGGNALSNVTSAALVGNVASANVALVVSQPLQPNITQVGTLTGLYSSGNVTASFFTGQGNSLSNILSSVLVGNVASANVALVVSQPLQPNITQVGTLTGLYSTGNVTASFFSGQGNALSNIQSAVLVGNVASANVALVVSQPAQPNVTSLGTLTGLTVNGLLSASNGSGIANLTAAAITGNVASANVALVVSQPLQPNITQVGTLVGLYASGNVTASFFAGQGNALTNVLSSVLVGNVASANVALVVSQPLQPNITQVGTLTGLYASGNVTASFFTGQGNGLTNVISSVLVGNVASANTALVVTQPAQPNVTSLGTLTGLTVQGLLSASNGSGIANLTAAAITGNVAQANVALVVSQPAQPNVTSLGTLTGLTVQGLLSASNGSGIANLTAAAITGNVANANVALVVSQSLQPNITQVGTLTGLYSSGNVTASFFSGQGNALTNVLSSVLVGNVASANVALVVSQPAQPNVTSLGTLTGLTVNGLLSATDGSGVANLTAAAIVGNVASANTALVVTQSLQPNITQVGTLTGLYSSGNVTASFFAGQGNALTNIISSVLVGNVASANTALVVTQSLQPNITQVGTLTGLYSTGNITATFFTGQGNALTNVLSSVLVGNVASANTALVVTQPLQPNITQVGTLTGLYSTGNVTASFFAGQGNALTNVLSSVLVGNVASANVALVVSQPAQPNVTSLGTLTGLNVAGNVYAANTVTTTNVVAAGFTSNSTNTVFNFDTLTIPFISATTLNVSGTANVTALWGSLATPAQPNVTSLGTLTGLTVNGLLSSTNGSGIANLTAASITGNVAQANVALVVSQPAQPNITSVGTLTSLTVSGNSNLQTLNVASIATPGVIPVSSGLFMNLNASYTLNSTGNWTGNIAGSITSNLFTLFGPNPVASWTTYGSNPLIVGPTVNGGFRFNQTGPYQFTVVLCADRNIKTVALSSNTSDVHSNLADPGVWLYCYRISVGQDPSVPIQIPFYVDSTSKYYYIDFEAMNKTGENIHKTAYTNVTAEGYTGSYVTLRPL